jgi:hypothetical protein
MAFSPSATAIVTPHKQYTHLRGSAFRPLASSFPVRAEERAYQIRDETEVRLDGRKCRYADVPSTAEIILMEIDSDDSRVILRIHFRSRK